LLFSRKINNEENRDILYLYDIDKKFSRIDTFIQDGVIQYKYWPDNYIMVDTIKFTLESTLHLFEYRIDDSTLTSHKSFLEEILM